MHVFTIISLCILSLILSDSAQKVMWKLLFCDWERRGSLTKVFAAGVAFLTVATPAAFAADGGEAAAGEANLKLPDLSQVQFLGVNGHKLLMVGILFCIFGLLFGLVIYSSLKNLPVHRAMGEISQLIWETCKTYLITQGKFLLLLWVFIAAIILLYFGVLLKYEAVRVAVILFFSLGGNRRQLRGGVVRVSASTVRQLADGFCQPARQALPFSRFPCARE